MNVPRLLCALAPAVLLAGGCSTTPDAAELVAEQSNTGTPVSEAEAAAALLDYIGAVNGALRSGDTGRLAAMTDPRCPCRDLVALIDDRFADGAALVGAAFDARQLTVLDRRGRRADVRAQVSVSEYAVRNRDGLVVTTRPARQYVATYTVAMGEDDAWRVVDVVPVS
jgi:hypothetical protein